jgi:hypothetical protein
VCYKKVLASGLFVYYINTHGRRSAGQQKETEMTKTLADQAVEQAVKAVRPFVESEVRAAVEHGLPAFCEFSSPEGFNGGFTVMQNEVQVWRWVGNAREVIKTTTVDALGRDRMTVQYAVWAGQKMAADQARA